jgi:hypothetical protein
LSLTQTSGRAGGSIRQVATAVMRSVTTLLEPPGCMLTPSRQSPASIVRFWCDTIDQLGVFAELLDEAEEPVQVDVVECRLHLVHHVERRRSADRNTAKRNARAVRLRSPPESSDSFLTFLPLGLRLDLDAGVQQVVGIRQAELELADAAGEQQSRTGG